MRFPEGMVESPTSLLSSSKRVSSLMNGLASGLVVECSAKSSMAALSMFAPLKAFLVAMSRLIREVVRLTLSSKLSSAANSSSSLKGVSTRLSA